MVLNSIKHVAAYTLLLLATLANGLPFLNKEISSPEDAVTTLKSRIKELRRAKLSLEWSIRAAERFRESQEALNHLVDGTDYMGTEAVHQSCSSITCPVGSISKIVNKSNNLCACVFVKDMIDLLIGIDVLQASDQDNHSALGRRWTQDQNLTKKELNFTYIPPPKTDITPQLLSESLAVQPQDTATVGSVIPFFQQGIISYGCQLNGFVASTLTLNASTDLPCNTIGSQPQPDLELRPKDIENGTAQAYVPDCSVVAVNMYDPNVITYWVQNKNGAIYSLTGSNKVEKINQLNTAASTSLVLRAKQAESHKRDEDTQFSNVQGQAIIDRAMQRRAVVPPDWHTASMTPEACAAIKCNNNGGDPAMYNPFTKTCGCREPAYVEIDHSS